MRPMRDPNYLAYIRTLPCLICGIHRSESAHTGPHGLSQKSCDYSAVPLCARCHRINSDSNHALGRNWAAHHGIDLALVIKQFNVGFVARNRREISLPALSQTNRAEHISMPTQPADPRSEVLATDRAGTEVVHGTTRLRTMTTVIALDHRLLIAADGAARKIGVSRSGLFSLALEDYLRNDELRSAGDTAPSQRRAEPPSPPRDARCDPLSCIR